MRLLIVSDIHGKVDNLKNIDLRNIDIVVFAGDAAPYGAIIRTFDVLKKFVEYVGSKPIVAVPGNMDPIEAYERAEKELGIVVVHGKSFLYKDIVFVGVGGSPPTPFGTVTEFTEDEIEKILDRAYTTCAIKERIVLVSHAPPHGTKCDIVFSGSHVGSKKVREFIEKTQPLLCICGHIHESRNIDELGRTKIVNPGPFYKGYYALATIENNNVDIELKKI